MNSFASSLILISNCFSISVKTDIVYCLSTVDMVADVEEHIAVVVAYIVAVDNFVAVEHYVSGAGSYMAVEADRDIGTAVPDICC